MNRYNKLNEYLKNKFGERVLKICIDACFTCPNRDGTCGKGGCIFCDEFGSGANKRGLSITEQIIAFLNSYRGQRANKFIVYFQNFSNTYDTVDNLKKKYDEALSVSDKIVGISVATRPDCINKDVAKLLASYKNKYYVEVELGLQTANDNTSKLINRGYNLQTFYSAVEILNEFDIDVVVHIMVGLPNETLKDVLNTVDIVNKCKISGVKIHSTYVVKNTKLCQMFKMGEYKPIELQDYILAVGTIIKNLRRDIVIHRVSGDAPKDRLIAPEWNAHKKWIMNGIDKFLVENNITQGQNLS